MKIIKSKSILGLLHRLLSELRKHDIYLNIDIEYDAHGEKIGYKLMKNIDQ